MYAYICTDFFSYPRHYFGSFSKQELCRPPTLWKSSLTQPHFKKGAFEPGGGIEPQRHQKEKLTPSARKTFKVILALPTWLFVVAASRLADQGSELHHAEPGFSPGCGSC